VSSAYTIDTDDTAAADRIETCHVNGEYIYKFGGEWNMIAFWEMMLSDLVT